MYRSYNLAATPRLGYLLTVIGFAIIFGAITQILLVPIFNLITPDSAYRMFLTQIASGLMVIMLPSVLTEQYFRRKHFTYLYRLSTKEFSRRSVLTVCLLILLSYPVVSALSMVMEAIPTPRFFNDIIALLEDEVQRSTELFLNEKRPVGIILSLFAIVIIAPIGEELLFRGALQGWLLTRIRNVHVVIWFVALVFSLIHMQWSGLLARFFLGALLGYVALYSGIWMSMLLHLLNNLITFVSYQCFGKDNLLSVESTETLTITIAGALIASVLILYTLKKMAARTKNNL